MTRALKETTKTQPTALKNHHQQDVVDEGSRKDQQIVDHRYVVVADQLLDNCGSATAKPWKARAMVHVSA